MAQASCRPAPNRGYQQHAAGFLRQVPFFDGAFSAIILFRQFLSFLGLRRHGASTFSTRAAAIPFGSQRLLTRTNVLIYPANNTFIRTSHRDNGFATLSRLNPDSTGWAPNATK